MRVAAYRIALLVFLSWTFACGARPPKQPGAAASEPSARWPIPAGWKHETFALPPSFAPEFPYEGTEDLRLMPGFNSPTAPDYWSYVFVCWPDHPPSFDAESVAATLTTYFRGLSAAVAGAKYQLDPAHFRTVLTPVLASERPRLAGQVAIVLALSPKATTDNVWKALRDAAGTLVCT